MGSDASFALQINYAATLRRLGYCRPILQPPLLVDMSYLPLSTLIFDHAHNVVRDLAAATVEHRLSASLKGLEDYLIKILQKCFADRYRILNDLRT